MLNVYLLIYVLGPPIISTGFWFVLLFYGPCLWSILAVFVGALIGSRLGRILGQWLAS